MLTTQIFFVGFPTLCQSLRNLFIYLFAHEREMLATWFLFGVQWAEKTGFQLVRWIARRQFLFSAVWVWAISEFPSASVSKRVWVPKYSYENDFDVDENETACRTRFHVKSFALMKQRHKRTRKWPILEKLHGISYLFSGAFCLQGKDNSFSIFTVLFCGESWKDWPPLRGLPTDPRSTDYPTDYPYGLP